MGDIKFLIAHYAHELWRRRWSALAIAWAVGLAGAFFAATRPDVYASRATVFVDTRSLLRNLFKDQVYFENPTAALENVRRLMYARPNIEKVAQRTNLDLAVKDERGREALLQDMEKKLELVRQGNDFYRIAYQHTDPKKAQEVVQAMLNLFLEEGVGRGSGVNGAEAEKALRYAEEQREQMKNRLTEAEARFASFERENREAIAQPAAVLSEKRSLDTDISRMQGDQTLYQQEIQELEAQLRATPRQVRTGEQVTRAPRRAPEPPPAGVKMPVPMSGAPTLEEQRFEAANQRATGVESELQSMLQRLTPQHPDVLALQRRAESARAEAEALRAAATAARAAQDAKVQEAMAHNAQVDAAYRDWQARQMIPEPDPVSTPLFGENPAYGQIQSQIGQRRSRLAAIDQQLMSLRGRMIEVDKLLQRQPEVMQSYEKISNEVDGLKKELQDIETKIQTLRATDEIGRQQLVTFNVVEPPQLPVSPVAPNRLILFLGAAIAGVGAGLGLTLLRVKLTDAMPSIVHLRNAFDLPILGVVSRADDPRGAAGAAAGHLVFLAAATMFVMAFAALIYVYHMQLWRPDFGALARGLL